MVKNNQTFSHTNLIFDGYIHISQVNSMDSLMLSGTGKLTMFNNRTPNGLGFTTSYFKCRMQIQGPDYLVLMSILVNSYANNVAKTLIQRNPDKNCHRNLFLVLSSIYKTIALKGCYTGHDLVLLLNGNFHAAKPTPLYWKHFGRDVFDLSKPCNHHFRRHWLIMTWLKS
ncbi:unnamed protein product [Vicia faba]|uniref:Uncharacterized protein n=1 Tax=Vicia faba TaxID=3906 RepID=A0AAV0ZGP5_VICFA|nr:unnamed protein product [Vicia faba]